MGRRGALGMEARVLRVTGEQVTLLTVAEPAASSATPFSVVESNESIDLRTATRTPMTAHVRWHKLGKVEYGEGGRTIRRIADIELSAQWLTLALQAVAVELSDGSVLMKCGEDLSEAKSTYTMTVEGYVKIQQ